MSRLARAALSVLFVAAPAGAVPVPEPGDRGHALTVIRGTTPVEIPVSFLGTYRGFAGPGYDLHLVELGGPYADTIGVAAGMSGSPVYFDGELLGAMAYRLGALPRKPVAGVTPIEDVLGGGRVSPGMGTSGGIAEAIRPIATPIVAGGLTPRVREWLGTRLDEHGLVLSAGGAASDHAAPPLVPGSPVGVELVRGDLRVAATGTVTWVDGDRVYAFGHPFLGGGQAEMPMVAAEVIHTLADLAGSVKLSNVGRELGVVYEDRQSAIVGRLGQRAEMVPVSVDVSGGGFGELELSFEVVRNSRLGPLLVAISWLNGLTSHNGFSDESTYLVRARIVLDGYPDVTFEKAYSGSGAAGPAFLVAGDLMATLSALWTSPLASIDVERIELEAVVRDEIVSYRVESVHYDRAPLGAGEPLIVLCKVRGYRGDIVEHRLEIPLPESVSSTDRLVLAVGNGAAIDTVLGEPLARQRQTATDVKTLVELLSQSRSSHLLTAVVYDADPAVISRGLAYGDLPPTAGHLLGRHPGPAGRDRTPRRTPRVVVEKALDGPVVGGRQVRLRVERGPEGIR